MDMTNKLWPLYGAGWDSFGPLRLPLTPLTELAATLPTVAAKLDAGAWTAAAERELLHLYDRLSAS
jgi:hypothetical protein